MIVGAECLRTLRRKVPTTGKIRGFGTKMERGANRAIENS